MDILKILVLTLTGHHNFVFIFITSNKGFTMAAPSRTDKYKTKDKLYKYTDAIQVLDDIKNDKIGWEQIDKEITTLLGRASVNKVAGKDGKEIKDLAVLVSIVEEFEKYAWDKATHYYREDILKIYRSKADKDLGAVITAKIEGLKKALQTPNRTKEWALSTELSSPNWHFTPEDKLKVKAKIDAKFEKLEKDLIDWVKEIQHTDEQIEINRKFMWVEKELKITDRKPAISNDEWKPWIEKMNWKKDLTYQKTFGEDSN